jgi:predicted RNA-binding Zn-ribbon protein involved in translation (DUF1610 family)
MALGPLRYGKRVGILFGGGEEKFSPFYFKNLIRRGGVENTEKESEFKCIKCNAIWSSHKPRHLFSGCPECGATNSLIVEYVEKDSMQ